QAIDPVLGDGKLGVVIVVGMDADAVGESSEARRDLAVASDDGGLAGCQAEIVQMPAHEFAAAGYGAGQAEAETVQDRLLADLHDFARKVFQLRVDDEFSDVLR